ncbi:glucose 1-dehydrogenase [Brevibacillus sp. NRS-1366]|uniref:glucose 1-dehydrogenase n=1 Tax=Brevibacillus sp. NRS-1366 TaxID=3233899 RepID=UPI003D2108D3
MQLFELNGKTAIVTGGGRGLGRGIALGLAQAGADIALISRTRQELVETAAEIEALGKKCLYQDMDIRDREALGQFVKQVAQEQGHIDVLVNGAGLNVRNTVLDTKEDDWDYVMDINLKSVLIASQTVIPYMQEQKSGKIINIASLTSELGFKGMAAYCASKGGVAQLTKAMAVELAEDGICVNAIGPGYFRTKMTERLFQNDDTTKWMLSRIPLGRTGDYQDLCGTAIFLASTASDYITGQTIYVDGGWLAS